jgi:hypothetical protein
LSYPYRAQTQRYPLMRFASREGPSLRGDCYLAVTIRQNMLCCMPVPIALKGRGVICAIMKKKRNAANCGLA